jgi:hypothetical protein
MVKCAYSPSYWGEVDAKGLLEHRSSRPAWTTYWYLVSKKKKKERKKDEQILTWGTIWGGQIQINPFVVPEIDVEKGEQKIII